MAKSKSGIKSKVEGKVKIADPGVVNRVIPIEQLVPHPRNYNQHDEGQIEDLRASLREFGQVRSIVAQATKRADQFLTVAGHGIVQAAKLEGLTRLKADVIPASWKPARVLAYLAALVVEVQAIEGDELARLAAGSEAMLKQMLASVQDNGEADAEPQIDRA